ncbi:MAG: hypothetical protein A2275_00100 [Bacteroidetes bacterium RIFOXYA12_FULL_35_11]|nr:MAG: hypothetical protein A2X01_06810 [Bacteroidetes bacterium GWF2_35_48]OFY81151.1 MAG: hypothetical protein A2275_00100 [Bacteroidetes bacterium RIFOXYA12_FULL_35_11]HBX49779.1 AAA family ATPase [Bacteroidales bacterium]
MKKLPIGKQDFSSLINEDCIYVDKSEYLYKLITTGFYYFLSRPRRFGKSLLISTLKEIFLGNKKLFKGLWIYDKIEWKKHPVIHIDFSELSYQNQSLDTAINKQLNKIIKLYSADKSLLKEDDTKDKFVELIKHLSKLEKVVILIDEYDKPIIDYIDNLEKADENRQILKNFYSAIKPLDSYLKFVFITGVSKFSHVSVFSDLNNLFDISYNKDYSSMLGYTQQELLAYFSEYIDILKNDHKDSEKNILKKRKDWYNGYSWDGVNFVYNPFSVLNLFGSNVFGDYWFRSGTPSFLIKLIKSNNYPVTSLANLKINKNLIDRYDIDKIDITVLLLQTGYLTIKQKEDSENNIVLNFPNYEVENSFIQYLFSDLAENNYTQNSVLIERLSLLLNSVCP